MKPTLNCKINYLKKNYMFSARIPGLLHAEHILQFDLNHNYDLQEQFEQIKQHDRAHEICDYMLRDCPKLSCACCLYLYMCKLKGTTDETYEPV